MMSSKAPILSYYNQLAAGYDADRFGNAYGSYLHRQEYALLNRLMKDREGNTADLGCGTGRMSAWANTGIDFSEAMLKEAKRKWPQKEFIQADITALPFADNSYDTIYSFHVFMHLDKETTETAFAEVQRVLRPGGLFIFDYPSAPRRDFFARKRKGWHGNTAYRTNELKAALPGMRYITHEGLLFFPIHHLPAGIRNYFRPIDSFLCRTLLKDYASYQLIVFEKK